MLCGPNVPPAHINRAVVPRHPHRAVRVPAAQSTVGLAHLLAALSAVVTTQPAVTAVVIIVPANHNAPAQHIALGASKKVARPKRPAGHVAPAPGGHRIPIAIKHVPPPPSAHIAARAH